MTHPYEGIAGGLCRRCGREQSHQWHKMPLPESDSTFAEFAKAARAPHPAEALQVIAAPDYFQLGDDSNDVQIVFRFRLLLRGISQVIHTKARSVELPAIEGDAFNQGRAATSIETPEKVEFYQVELPGPLRTISGEAAAAFWKWYQENR
jgi:hypothetical protein